MDMVRSGQYPHEEEEHRFGPVDSHFRDRFPQQPEEPDGKDREAAVVHQSRRQLKGKERPAVDHAFRGAVQSVIQAFVAVTALVKWLRDVFWKRSHFAREKSAGKCGSHVAKYGNGRQCGKRDNRQQGKQAYPSRSQRGNGRRRMIGNHFRHDYGLREARIHGSRFAPNTAVGVSLARRCAPRIRQGCRC